jgi:vitamin B12 transporter
VVLGSFEVMPSVRLEAAHDEIVDSRFNQPLGVARPETYLLPIGRLALLERATHWLSLRANAGRYARLPTMFERYGNTGLLQGSSMLVPERGLNADVGATLTLGTLERWGLTVDGAVFASRASELIEFQVTRRFQRAINIGEARILGAELAVAGRLGRHGRVVAQGTFTDARDVSDDGAAADRGKLLPQRPRVRAYARPELRVLPLGWGWTAGLYGDVDVTGGNYRESSNSGRPIPARVLFGAGASVTSPAGHWRLVASAQNLGDAAVADLSDFPRPGRSLFLTLEWSSANSQQP